MKNRFFRSMFFFLFLLAVVGGCSSKKPTGPPPGTLKGKITLDSKPVTKGFLVASPINPGATAVKGPIGPDGRFVIENVPAGPVRIFLELPPGMDELDPRGQPAGVGKGVPGKMTPIVGKEPPPKDKTPETPKPTDKPIPPALQGLPEEEQKAWEI